MVQTFPFLPYPLSSCGRPYPTAHASIFCVILAIFLAPGPLWAAGPASDARPNILLLFADDQRADTIAALGNPIIQTPNLDRLVHSGVSFQRAYMQGGMQGATCVPSRAMLLSGRSLFRIDERLQRDMTWPAAFARAGYTTFMSGKWHNGPDSIAASFQSARSVFAGGMTNPMAARLSDMQDGKLTRPHIGSKHACAIFADEAIRFLQAPKEGPFFCYVPFDAPHDPHIVPDGFPIRYDPSKVPLPANFKGQHPFDNGEMTVRDEQLLPWPRRPADVRKMTADYYRYISFLDAQIGRILDALAASPHARSTIVVFAADSGVARGGHGLIGKQNLYEHSIRVPLIISGPGVAKGKTTMAMCYLFDVLPTLGSLCHVAGPSTSEGTAWTAVLQHPEQAGRRHLFFAYRSLQRAVRDERWKLIRYPQINRSQLFDLKTDPHEMNDFSGKPEFADTIAQMTTLMKNEMHRYADPAPLSVPDPKPAAWSPPPRRKPGQR
jgi:arylsulfatase A-like enzyme